MVIMDLVVKSINAAVPKDNYVFLARWLREVFVWDNIK